MNDYKWNKTSESLPDTSNEFVSYKLLIAIDSEIIEKGTFIDGQFYFYSGGYGAMPSSKVLGWKYIEPFKD